MGNKKQKISVNPDSLIRASELLKEAEQKVYSAINSINAINVSNIGGPGMGSAGVMANIKSNAATVLNKEVSLLSGIGNDLKTNANKLKNVDSKSNGIKDSEIKKKSSSSKKKKTSTSSFISTASVTTSKKTKKSTSKKKKKKKKKLKVKVAALTTKVFTTPLPAKLVVNTPVEPTVDVRTESYNKLEGILKSGIITSEVGVLYDTLKTFGMGNEADSLLNKYGYRASKDENGNTVISKITEENEIPINDANSNQTDNDQSSNESKTNEKNDSEVVASEVESTTNDVNTNVNNSNSTEQSNNETYNNVRKTNYSSSNTGGGNANSNTEAVGNNNISETANEPSSIVDNSNKVIEKKPSTNVVSIKDDSSTSSKKSSGMGAAIPIGLGAIATGAAAVAGVRYVKNRHENQEEYDEDYDDENNQLDDNNSEYIDSAEYNNESDYTNDDYLGPAGSTYTDVDADNNVDDSYVDPEDLEIDTDDDFSDDTVLKQLNSNE